MFDLKTALHEWLAIPAEEQPADHYRLIGASRFEADMNIIVSCAEQRLRFLRQFDSEEHRAIAGEVTGLVEAARNTLLSPTSKRNYDASLRGAPAPGDDAPLQSPDSMVPVTQVEGVPGEMPQSLAPAADEAAGALESHPAAEQSSTETWLIGRHRMCDVIVNSPYVSTRHCELLRTGEGYYLRDLESTNKTYVNSKQVSPGQLVRVSSRDIITLGKLTAMPWPPHAAR